MFRKLIISAAVVLAAAFACAAAFAQQTTPPSTLPSSVGSQVMPTVIGTTGIGTPVIVQTRTDYTFKAGDFVASAVNWIWLAFGGTIATLISALLVKGLNYVGIQTTQQQRDKLQEMVANGLNKAAAQAQVAAQGKTDWDVRIKNQLVEDTVRYVQTHGADTIKALGLDPQSGEAVEAIKARIETAIVDDNTPTNPAVNPGITASTTLQPANGLQLAPLTKTTT